MSQKVIVFRTADGVLEVEIAPNTKSPAIVRVAGDEMKFEKVEDFDEWMRTLANARDEFTAVRAS